MDAICLVKVDCDTKNELELSGNNFIRPSFAINPLSYIIVAKSANIPWLTAKLSVQ